MRGPRFLAVVLAVALTALSAAAQPASDAPSEPACVFPAAPGGGMDSTCRIAADLLNRIWTDRMLSVRQGTSADLGVARLREVNHGPASRDGDAVTAFSSGTLRTLARGGIHGAEGRPLGVDDARWVASLGSDHGAVFVADDAPWRNLADLVEAVADRPDEISFGGSGDRGDMDYAKLHRFVGHVAPARADAVRTALDWEPFASGGDAMRAVVAGDIDVYMGEIAEWTGFSDKNELRVLAVLARDRLPAPFADLPTSYEQGVPMTWLVMRGVYLPPNVSDAHYRWWVSAFRLAFASPSYTRLAHQHGLRDDGLAGPALRTAVADEIDDWKTRFADVNPQTHALLAALPRTLETWLQILAYALGAFIVANAAARLFAEPSFAVADTEGGSIWPVPPRYTTPRLTYTAWLIIFVGLALIVFVLLEQWLRREGAADVGIDPWMNAYPPLVAAALMAGAVPVLPVAQTLLRQFRDFCHRRASIPDSAKGRYAALGRGVERIAPADVRRATELVGDGVVASEDFHDRERGPAWRLAQALHLIAAAGKLGAGGGGRYAQTLARPELRLAELRREAAAIGREVRFDNDGNRHFEQATSERVERLYAGALQLVVCLVHACERSEAAIARRLTEVGFNAGVATVGIRFSLTPIAFVGVVMFLVAPLTGFVLYWVIKALGFTLPAAIAGPENVRNAALVLWLLLWLPAAVTFVCRGAASETWWPIRVPWERRGLTPLTLMPLVGLVAGVVVMVAVHLAGILGPGELQERLLFAFLGSAIALAATFALDEPVGGSPRARGLHMLVFTLAVPLLLVVVTFMGMFLAAERLPTGEDLFVYALVGSVGLVLGAGLWIVAAASTELLGVDDATDYALVTLVGARLEELAEVPVADLDAAALRRLAPQAVADSDRRLRRHLVGEGLVTTDYALTEAGERRVAETLRRAHGQAAGRREVDTAERRAGGIRVVASG